MTSKEEFEAMAKLGGLCDPKVPQSARDATFAMMKIIQDSQNPADVSLAVCMGLSYALAVSKDETKTMEVIVATALQMKEELLKLKPTIDKLFSEMVKKGEVQ